MKQPHEDVAGVDRGDWLLDLDERAMAHRDALAAMAQHLQRASMVGSPAPVVKEIWGRISDPKVGDLVVEATYWWPNRDADHRAKSLGILLARREEWAQTDEEWEAYVAEEPYALEDGRARERDAWYIQYGSKAVDICRWANCTFVALPLNPREFRP